jgi:hypothetical protein
MDHRREARVGFVVMGGDAAELLDLAEEVSVLHGYNPSKSIP